MYQLSTNMDTFPGICPSYPRKLPAYLGIWLTNPEIWQPLCESDPPIRGSGPPVEEGPALPHLEEEGAGHIVGDDQEDAEEDGHRPPWDVVLLIQVTFLVVVLLARGTFIANVSEWVKKN